MFDPAGGVAENAIGLEGRIGLLCGARFRADRMKISVGGSR
jgi:hypothetical protein